MRFFLLCSFWRPSEDSGGAGKYRGGMGLRREITPVGHDCIFNGAGERFSNEPWGVFGGSSGDTGQFIHTKQDGLKKKLAIKPSRIVLKAGEKILVETPGAGGYGAPEERSDADITDDVESGKFSDAYVKLHYER